MRVSPGTIARTIILALALINQILVSMGHSIIDIDNETLEEFITLSITVAAALTAWWKNNSFTESAILADEHLKSFKEIEKEK